MTRSSWKCIFNCFDIKDISERANFLQNKRRFWILDKQVEQEVAVPYDYTRFNNIRKPTTIINQNAVGLRLGQLFLTKAKVRPNRKKKKKKEKKMGNIFNLIRFLIIFLNSYP